MIKFKKMTLKNFLSIGNKEQVVFLDNNSLTLILGENADIGSGIGSGARNGVGKSAIIQALCYAIYGIPLTQIKRDNLINKINRKNMVVTLEFEKNGVEYFIERGRKPNFLNFYIDKRKINNVPETEDDENFNSNSSEETEGDFRWTQKEIQKVIGISINLFRHLIALNTFTMPFLSMPVSQQRQIVEELFGITRLSEKAELLKLKIKETKDRIREEEIKIESIKTSNERIRKSIIELENRSRIWQKNLSETIKNLEKEISLMENLNIEEEIRIHEEKQKYLKNRELLEKTKSNLNHVEKNILENEKRLKKSENYRNRICEEKCPMCGQKLHNKDILLENLDREIFELKKNLEENYGKKRKYEKEIEQLFMDENILNEKTFYKEISDAYNHKIILQKLKESMKEKKNQKNPYEEQIKSLEETGIQEIDFTTLNNLTYRKNHQELLLKLLMNKDSFIRKKIMDQSLNYLNSRLKYYTESLQLPHQVKFLNDLSVEINELGVDFDFDNLSRGEKTRLILALSWAFRDVYESMNDNINIMFIDELIDNGLDQLGVESAVLQLKKISTENRKNIFLISHREDLTNQVENILYVIKENGFTNILTEET